MPIPEIAYLIDKAVLWDFLGTHDRSGEPQVAAPVEIRARWFRREVEALDRNGNPIMLDMQALVDRPVKNGSRMWEGTLAAWNADPTGDLLEVKTFSHTKDIKNRVSHYRVGLMRYRKPE